MQDWVFRLGLNLFFKLGISKFKYRSRGLECCNRGCISSLFLPIKANHVKTYHFYSCKAFLNLAMAKKYIIHRLSPCVIGLVCNNLFSYLLINIFTGCRILEWAASRPNNTSHRKVQFDKLSLFI